MSDAITFQLVDPDCPRAPSWWEARREGQATPVGYGDNQHEALEALLRAEHKATT